jgi:3-oxoacyl-[acyl-carrier protein] reductase
MANQVALVTGASRGIGQAIAERLGREEGMKVILTGRDREALAAVSAGIPGSEWIALDLREAAAAQQLLDFALDKGGRRLDILVNNAGATKRGCFTDLTDDEWLDGYSLKLFAAVRLTRLAWPHLAAAKGSVVNIAGVGGRTPGPEFALGGSVNAALMAVTKSLAETGIADGVRVNAINPGAVRTARLTRRIEAIMKSDAVDAAEAERRFVLRENVTRIGEPADIAELTAFLVSPAGSFLQGALIDSDGGATKSL